MINYIVGFCVGVSALLEVMSYQAQVVKVQVTKKSKDVSTKFYLRRVVKYVFALVALFLSANWVGFIIETVALIACVVTLAIICHYKPDDWGLFN